MGGVELVCTDTKSGAIQEPKGIGIVVTGTLKVHFHCLNELIAAGSISQCLFSDGVVSTGETEWRMVDSQNEIRNNKDLIESCLLNTQVVQYSVTYSQSVEFLQALLHCSQTVLFGLQLLFNIILFGRKSFLYDMSEFSRFLNSLQ
jgi:hypothetical protein